MLWTWRQNLGWEEKQEESAICSEFNENVVFCDITFVTSFQTQEEPETGFKKENVEMRREIFNTAFSFSREKEPELGGRGCGAQWPSNAERSCCHLPTQTKKMTMHESTPEKFMRINELSEGRTWNGNETPQFEMDMKLEERQLWSEKR